MEIDNGKLVKIWKDKWISHLVSLKTQFTIKVLYEDAKVTILIYRDTNQWNVPLIKSILLAYECEEICKFSINICNSLDKLVWGCTDNGKLSFRNAYFAYKEKYKIG